MDSRFHGLPPIKRFKLLQQNTPQNPIKHSCLPAKKRIESWNPPTTCCLPAKKRVWAPPPLQQDPAQEEEEEEEKPTKRFPSDTPFDNDINAKIISSTHVQDATQQEEKSTKQFPSKTPLDDNINNKVIPNAHSQDPTQEEEKSTKQVPSNTPLDEDINNKVISVTHCNDEEDDEEDGIICAICNSTDGDPLDPIVFCDGCDLMVHASCYGNPLIQAVPEGDWYCSRCQSSSSSPSKTMAKEGDYSCCLCPIERGAIKPTVDGRWAHIMCALLVPEVFFRDSTAREGIDCSRVPCRRWEGVCYICDSSMGCVIECSEFKCSSRFHVSCGLKDELSIEYREGRGGGIVAGFCNIHTQIWKKQQLTGKFKIVPWEKK